MPYPVPSVDVRNCTGWAKQGAITVDTSVDIHYDQWWQLGARELLKASNLDIIRLLFNFELWPDWEVPQECLVARSSSELDGFLADLDIKGRGKSHAEKAEMIQAELTDQSVGSVFDVDPSLDVILQELDDKVAAELLMYFTSPQLAGIHFRHWIRTLSQDLVPEVDDWLDTVNEFVRSLCTSLRNEPSLRMRFERIWGVRMPLYINAIC